MLNLSDIFATNLRSLLEKTGWTREQFGKKIGVSDVQAGKYVKGASSPPFVVVEKIAKAFGVNPSDLYRSDQTPAGVLPTPKEALAVLNNFINKSYTERDCISGFLEHTYDTTQYKRELGEFVEGVFPVFERLSIVGGLSILPIVNAFLGKADKAKLSLLEETLKALSTADDVQLREFGRSLSSIFHDKFKIAGQVDSLLAKKERKKRKD